ncbi:MAG: hypothetical protein ACRC2T_20320 [Thermoguttaceae bacterium]
MDELRREILIGYIAGALEKDEEQKLERELESNAALRKDLAKIREQIAPFEDYSSGLEKTFPAPVGLAKRSCDSIWSEIDTNITVNQTSEKVEIKTKKSTEVNAKTEIAAITGATTKAKTNEASVHDVKLEAGLIINPNTKNTLPALSDSLELPRVYGNLDSQEGLDRVKVSSFIFPVATITMLLFLTLQGVYWVKSHLVNVYTNRAIRTISQNSSMYAQLYGSVELDDDGTEGTQKRENTSSLLAKFTESQASSKTLDFLDDNKSYDAISSLLEPKNAALNNKLPTFENTSDSDSNRLNLLRNAVNSKDAVIGLDADDNIDVLAGPNIIYRAGRIFVRRI